MPLFLFPWFDGLLLRCGWDLELVPGSIPDAGTRGMCSLLSGLAIVGGELFGSPMTVRDWIGKACLSLDRSQ